MDQDIDEEEMHPSNSRAVVINSQTDTSSVNSYMYLLFFRQYYKIAIITNSFDIFNFFFPRSLYFRDVYP